MARSRSRGPLPRPNLPTVLVVRSRVLTPGAGTPAHHYATGILGGICTRRLWPPASSSANRCGAGSGSLPPIITPPAFTAGVAPDASMAIGQVECGSLCSRVRDLPEDHGATGAHLGGCTVPLSATGPALCDLCHVVRPAAQTQKERRQACLPTGGCAPARKTTPAASLTPETGVYEQRLTFTSSPQRAGNHLLQFDWTGVPVR